MTDGPKPIETVYNGYRFRSRLEARWACFLDAFDVRYEYEKEGFTLTDNLRYLPDFWLPGYGDGGWLEVKAGPATDQERAKVWLLAIQDRPHSVILLQGQPWPGQYYAETAVVDPIPPAMQEYIDQAIAHEHWWLIYALMQAYPHCDWMSIMGPLAAAKAPRLHPDPRRVIEHPIKQTFWTFCPVCEYLIIGEPGCPCEVCGQATSSNHPRLLAAFSAARSARFEFGESGARR